MTLPSAIQTEALVLGLLLMDWASYGPLLPNLTADDFSLEQHKILLRTIRAMDTAGQVVDTVTAAQELTRIGKLANVGGVSKLASLTEGLPHIHNADAYVRTLKEKAALRKLIFLGDELQTRASLQEHAKDIVEWAAAAIGGTVGTSERGEMLDAAQIIEHAGGMDAFFAPGRSGRGIATPWERLNEYTSGLHPGEMVVLAANTGMGKSSAALQIGLKAAQANEGVCLFSLEMSRESLLDRLVCQIARVDAHRYRTGHTTGEDRAQLRYAAGHLAELPLWIAEHGCSTVTAIRSAIKRQKAVRQVGVAVVDYLQIMSSAGRWSNRVQEISEMTRALKLIAIEEEVVMVVLSQLSRDNMKQPPRPPMLSDLRDSGSIEQDADVVLFLWRPEMVTRDREDLRGHAELIIAKQRSGPTGKVNLVWLGNFTKFESAAEDR